MNEFYRDFIEKHNLSRGKLIAQLQRLNKHYSRTVKFRTGYPLDGTNSACADIRRNLVIFPPEPFFYNRYVLAHEFAHIIHSNGRYFFSEKTQHGKKFDAHYKEICLVLGLFYIPTHQLSRELGLKFYELGLPKRIRG